MNSLQSLQSSLNQQNQLLVMLNQNINKQPVQQNNQNNQSMTDLQSSMTTIQHSENTLQTLITMLLEIMTGQKPRQLWMSLSNNSKNNNNSKVVSENSLIDNLQQMLVLLRSVANAQTNLQGGLTNTTENLSDLSNVISLLLPILYENLTFQSREQATNLMNQLSTIATETNNSDLQQKIIQLAQQGVADMQR